MKGALGFIGVFLSFLSGECVVPVYGYERLARTVHGTHELQWRQVLLRCMFVN